MFFSWSRNRSFGKGPKKRELTDFNYSQSPPSFSLYKKVNFCRLVRTERLVFLGCFFSSPPADFSTINGRRESQGSLSSGASLELGTSGSGKLEVGLSAGSPRNLCVSMNLLLF